VQPDDILDRVAQILRRVLESPDLAVTEQTSARDVSNWDSLNHVTLIMAIEREFGIKFALGELQSLRNAGALVALIRQKTR
jgi:acyl carrier protein